MFKARLISGIVLVVVLAAALIMGDLVLWALLLFISLVGLQEFYHAVRKKDEESGTSRMTEAVGYAGCICYYLIMIMQSREQYLFLTLIMILTVMMFVYVFSYPAIDSTQLMTSYFGVIYVPVMLSFIYLTRRYTDGIFLVWLIFISSWVCDTCAYCVGMLIGKHKLAPKLSPKKSVEGAIGGVAGSALAGALYGYVLTITAGQASPEIWSFAIIGGIGAIISQIGDLTASAIKRNHNIKDYGKLIPGHGGILDRFDSVIVTAPMIYILAVLFLSI
ncbi:phosphatidate cytidylyltransferase [bacterium C-53]|nr:phosphatidate cytidylyltransferase [Lachnospiraceae bacterium]NBI02179.1 phosphatidate cytidylyltransferase [Lachnospiraceae bacterium]RKJ10432.1 phosphatidate cytidylyltransferase [bacterium C-53]